MRADFACVPLLARMEAVAALVDLTHQRAGSRYDHERQSV